MRYEIKIPIQNNFDSDFYDFINFDKNIKRAFDDRVINSIYFDYPDFRLFDYSEEGLETRQKIRLRYYGNKFLLNELNLEIKESFAHSKKKYASNFLNTVTPIPRNINNAKALILNKNIQPTIKVSYDRRYFFSEEFGRLTLDENIIYEKAEWDIFLKNFKFKYKIRELRSVCEHKLENNNSTDEIFTIPNTRFSKYCEAVKSIYKI